jgi:hypothetical protein
MIPSAAKAAVLAQIESAGLKPRPNKAAASRQLMSVVFMVER